MTSQASIVVTGVGAWSAAGGGAAALWDAALSGRDGLPSVSVLSSEKKAGDAGDCVTPGYVAPDPPPDPAFRLAARLDRQALLALAAAREAWETARLGRHDPARVAILVGTARGPAAALVVAGPVRPTQATRTALASASGALSLAFGVTGPCLTVSATCASGAQAIALGATLLVAGEVDAVLAGGADAPLTPELLAQFAAAGLLGTACRPFDAARDGLVLGEGAAFLALERTDDFSGPTLARLAGWATGAEAHQRAAARSDGAGLQRVLHRALSQAGLAPADVGLVFAHGTGTRVNDAAEAAALRSAFPPTATPWITATKAVTGHALGASPALEAALAVQALRHGFAPPVTGCAQPDAAAAGLRLARAPEPFDSSRAVVTLAQGFWGNNSALVWLRT